MIEYLIAGGPVMIPIALASVVGLAAFLERVWALRRRRVTPRAVIQLVLDHARAGRLPEARAVCAGNDSAVARILEVALDMAGRPRATIKERLEEVGRREAAELERYVPVLGTIGALGPLLGLLGTVGGMILTFEGVQRAGTGTVEQLAGGIAQALVTTFAGLVVAIPAVIAHRYLLSRVDGLLVELEEASLLALELVCEEARSPAAPEAHR